MTLYASTCPLPDRGVVRVEGDNVRPFLQGLITCDMEKVRGDKAAYGALLSPQGKILFDFLVVAHDGGFLFDLPAALAEHFVKRLGFYRLRARIVIEILSGGAMIDTQSPSDLVVAARFGDDAAPSGAIVTYADPRAPLGTRAILPRALAGGLPELASAYEARRIEAGVPKGAVDFAYGDTFPHEANLDRLHGVDFTKGCFVGQEVVARVEHRGTARKRIARVAFKGPMLEPGTPVTAGDQEIGTIGSSYFGHALAMLRLDKAREALAAGTPLMAGKVLVTLVDGVAESGGDA
jgi:tRNA-modifying protein YgfZ